MCFIEYGVEKMKFLAHTLLKMYRGGSNETWDPCRDLFGTNKTKKYAIVVLNIDINLPPTFLINLWNEASLRVTVDGGTAKWVSFLKKNHINDNEINPPDLITGDMDSIPQDLLDYFISNETCKVIGTPDQMETDFTKALREIGKVCNLENIELDAVYVIADTCGRLDHILANLNTLYKTYTILNQIQVFQLASNSLTWVLRDGVHHIEIPEILREKQEWCALVPLKSPTFASSTGLKWNLDRSKLEFGGLVSTSNTYDVDASNVTVSTDDILVWSMGIEALLAKM